ncbi:hypothetical protein BKA67DRAFT_537153 [Truncatella angustata]|uniref:Uncharacterized protein n=1 Tax=Truncatella angustata TaxID=152316 RepID=A0A9P8ZXZ0_9PEZI|nr:uncharacterized protein BKA67DRAFT_537153 [Truncatella angustata]KAH6653479.1 hypothetical protein BKA67DRAFT_537153 [Truncatella angustata]
MTVNIDKSQLEKWGLRATIDPTDGQFTGKLYCEKMDFYFNVPEELLNADVIHILQSDPEKAVPVDSARASSDALTPCKDIQPIDRMNWITSFSCVVDLLQDKKTNETAMRPYIHDVVSRLPNLWFTRDGDKDVLEECLTTLLLQQSPSTDSDINNDKSVANLDFKDSKENLYWVVDRAARHIRSNRIDRAKKFQSIWSLLGAQLPKWRVQGGEPRSM